MSEKLISNISGNDSEFTAPGVGWGADPGFPASLHRSVGGLVDSFNTRLNTYSLTSSGTDTIGVTHTVQAEDNNVLDVAWNNDGTRFYESGQEQKVRQFDASTKWDITTLSLNGSKSGNGFWFNGLAFNDDGSKMYESHDGLWEYNLSTPFDVTTASLHASDTSYDDILYSITWKPDGTKMWYTHGTAYWAELSASTPFDITTLTEVDRITFGDGRIPTDLIWNPTGTRMFTADAEKDEAYVKEYDASTAYDFNTVTKVEEIFGDFNNAVEGCQWADGGTKLITAEQDDDKADGYIVEYS